METIKDTTRITGVAEFRPPTTQNPHNPFAGACHPSVVSRRLSPVGIQGLCQDDMPYDGASDGNKTWNLKWKLG